MSTEPASVHLCPVDVWDGPYKFPCGRHLTSDGKCLTHWGYQAPDPRPSVAQPTPEALGPVQAAVEALERDMDSVRQGGMVKHTMMFGLPIEALNSTEQTTREIHAATDYGEPIGRHDAPTTEAQKGVQGIGKHQPRRTDRDVVVCAFDEEAWPCAMAVITAQNAEINDLRSAVAAVLSALGLPADADPVEAIGRLFDERNTAEHWNERNRREYYVMQAERDTAREAARLAEQARHGALTAANTTVEAIQRELDGTDLERRSALAQCEAVTEELNALRAEVERIAAGFDAARDAAITAPGQLIWRLASERLRAALASPPTAQTDGGSE